MILGSHSLQLTSFLQRSTCTLLSASFWTNCIITPGFLSPSSGIIQLKQHSGFVDGKLFIRWDFVAPSAGRNVHSRVVTGQKVLVINPSCLTRRPAAGRSTDRVLPSELTRYRLIQYNSEDFQCTHNNFEATLATLVRICVYLINKSSWRFIALLVCLILACYSFLTSACTAYLKEGHSCRLTSCKEKGLSTSESVIVLYLTL